MANNGSDGNSKSHNGNINHAPPEFTGEQKKFYDKLIELREELTNQLQNHFSSRSYHGEPGEDLADIGSENFSRDTDLSLMSEEGRKIMLVNEAIERLIHGDFGKCFDCGCEIAEGRLEAIPYAKLCIKCKEQREQNDGLPPEDSAKEELVEE